MDLALTIFALSSGMLALCVLLWSKEQARGQRYVAGRLRGALDRVLLRSESRLQSAHFWCQHLVLRWGWRYSLHMLLRSILLGITRLYDWLVTRFERNLEVTKQLRKERKRWRKGK